MNIMQEIYVTHFLIVTNSTKIPRFVRNDILTSETRSKSKTDGGKNFAGPF